MRPSKTNGLDEDDRPGTFGLRLVRVAATQENVWVKAADRDSFAWHSTLGSNCDIARAQGPSAGV
jgi:hypothetical protein